MVSVEKCKFAGIISLLFLFLTLPVRSEAQSKEIKLKNTINQQSVEKLLFVFIDFQSLQCPTCLDSYLKFNTDLELRQEDISKTFVIGFLHPNSIMGTKEYKILKKQLKGFSVANNISYPIIIDKLGIFAGLESDFRGIVLIHEKQKLQRKWEFPLSMEANEELFRLLQKNNDEIK